MSTLDIKEEMSTLEEEEIAKLHDLSENLHFLTWIQTSMSWKKVRVNWLKEGDANTKKIPWSNVTQTAGKFSSVYSG